MFNWSLLLSRLIAGAISFLDATNLRQRVYEQQDRIETLEIALDDIKRISASRVNNSERHRLIVGIISNVTEQDNDIQ